jgi:hypothetical protein
MTIGLVVRMHTLLHMNYTASPTVVQLAMGALGSEDNSIRHHMPRYPRGERRMLVVHTPDQNNQETKRRKKTSPVHGELGG